MLDTFNFPTPQSANYQEFLGGNTTRTWVKPRGAKMVRIMLIGVGGGRGNGTSLQGSGAGGSGAVLLGLALLCLSLIFCKFLLVEAELLA